jgi:hypothetical protein
LIDLVGNPTQRHIPRHELFERLIDAADLQAQLTPLYEYSRDIEQLRARATPDDIRSALRGAGLWDDENRDLFAAIAQLERPRD